MIYYKQFSKIEKMILAYKFKLKPNSSQKAMMVNWLDMLRSHYNFCLKDRIESYEHLKSPKLGNYSDLRTKAQCCPLTCSISKNSGVGEPFKKSGKKRSAYEQQSSELPRLKKSRPWYKQIHSTVLQQNLRRLDTNTARLRKKRNLCSRCENENYNLIFIQIFYFRRYFLLNQQNL
jgi:putative transposase